MDRNFQTRRNETLDFRNRVVTFRFSLSTRDTVRYGHTLGTILGSSSDSGWSIGPIRDSIPLVVVFPLLLSAVPTQHPRIVANPRIDEGIRPAYILLDARVSNYGDFSTFCLLKTQKKCVSSYFFCRIASPTSSNWHGKFPSTEITRTIPFVFEYPLFTPRMYPPRSPVATGKCAGCRDDGLRARSSAVGTPYVLEGLFGERTQKL